MSQSKPDFKLELIEALLMSNEKVVPVPEHILEELGEHTFIVPFKEEIELYKSILLSTMMDIIYEEFRRLTPAQQEIIYHYFFLEKRIKHISQELHLSIPTLIERLEGALKKLRLRLSRNPIFTRLYDEYIEEDLPANWL